PSNANEPEKCGMLETRFCRTANLAASESLLPDSNRGCAPWFCRKPPEASIGCVLSAGGRGVSFGCLGCVHAARCMARHTLIAPHIYSNLFRRSREKTNGACSVSRKLAIFLLAAGFVE